jgi:hypothetical protein
LSVDAADLEAPELEADLEAPELEADLEAPELVLEAVAAERVVVVGGTTHCVQSEHLL